MIYLFEIPLLLISILHGTFWDPLTRLYNRFGAERRIKEGQTGIMIYMDLDNFKQVNDELAMMPVIRS